MNVKTIIIYLTLSFVNGYQEFVDEFSKNILDDDFKYSENQSGREHFVRKIRSVEEDYRNVETIDTEEYFGEIPEDVERRNKREITEKQENKVEDLGNPLEVVVLDVGVNGNETKNVKSVAINDFIRFKRDVGLEQDDKQRSKREKYNNSREEESKRVKEEVRPPNVHFITQRRSESSPPAIYYDYDDYHPQDRRKYERYPRRYDSNPYVRNYNPNYYEPQGYQSQHYEPPRYTKQRRIIYYATLPEDVRSPKDRYTYREPPYLSGRYVPLERREPFGYRRSYLHPKARYDGDVKTSYPLKVSADVNVREVKKNPERRIYSEVDGGRYDYLSPYEEQYRL